MKYNYQSDDQVYTVEIEKDGEAYRARVEGQAWEVKLVQSEQGTLSFMIDNRPVRAYIAADGTRRWVSTNGRVFVLDLSIGTGKRASRGGDDLSSERIVRAPMPGQVRAVQVSADAQVEKGQTLLLLEAMKMEIRIQAPRAGHLTRLLVKVGQSVDRDQVLVEIE